MNPAIVIPSYWTERDAPPVIGRVVSYDHATPIDKPLPELELCLDSLEAVRGVLRVIILLVSSPDCAEAARARVEGICRMHPALNPLIVGPDEGKEILRVVARVAPRLSGEPVALRGYGAIRNMGIAACAALGHDVAVFLDDDEMVADENFLIDAVHGLGMETRQQLPIYAKSGFFLRKDESPFAPVDTVASRTRFWPKNAEFNLWMRRALTATRISRSNTLCGSCFALSAQAFGRVAFDPFITCGEDLDYLLNLRMRGMDVWFDNAWRVRHTAARQSSCAASFLQDVHRWEYELAKLAAGNATIGLRQVRPESLEPYPSAWLSPAVRRRIFLTALLRVVLGPERRAYLGILLMGQLRARRWARREVERYFELQTYWPRIVAGLWDNRPLALRLQRLGQPAEAPSTQLGASDVGVMTRDAAVRPAPGAASSTGDDDE